MAVTIREISAGNFVEAIRLKVAPSQERFVASNAASIAQSKFDTFLECYGIYEGDTMVGFSAFGRNPEDGAAWIARHMIGADHQRKGLGRLGLQAIVAHMRDVYGCPSIFLDVAPDNAAAIKLYEGAGFVDTGNLQGEGKIYRLDFD
jgi:diamine N-acetyltransferase